MSIIDLLKDKTTDVIERNMALYSTNQVYIFLQRHLKTQAASHVLVTALANGIRNLPISCIPARTHINIVIEHMKQRNMKVAGEYKITFEQILL